ncbi:MAG: hypothetical protein HONBIEJF_01468 [Fimbriimonadaceae bacterium]|nr:hypothetical protein [Fimbriimonadaceae bacterium]
MDRTVLALVLRHIIEGYDIPTPAGMLRIKAGTASIQPDHVPYSLATNLAHALLWQDIWLEKLAGKPRRPQMEVWSNDFRVPEESEFPVLKKRFLAGLNEALRLTESDPFDHKLPTDEEAIDALVRIAVHGAYHIGQMNLIKRTVRAG